MRKTYSWNTPAINEGLSQARFVYLKPTHKETKTGRVLETQCIGLTGYSNLSRGKKRRLVRVLFELIIYIWVESEYEFIHEVSHSLLGWPQIEPYLLC